MPSSSRDLIEEQLRQLLEEHQRNLIDGVTLRSLDRRLRAMEDREMERLEAGSGHYNIPPPGYVPPPIILDARGRPSKRPSNRPPWVEKIVTSKPILTVIAVVLLGLYAHLAARCGVLAAIPPPVVVAPLPPAVSR